MFVVCEIMLMFFVVAEIERFLLYASQNAIRGIAIEGLLPDLPAPEAMRPIISLEYSFVALDYQYLNTSDNNAFIYYSDVKKNFIFRSRRDGTGMRSNMRSNSDII